MKPSKPRRSACFTGSYRDFSVLDSDAHDSATNDQDSRDSSFQPEPEGSPVTTEPNDPVLEAALKRLKSSPKPIQRDNMFVDLDNMMGGTKWFQQQRRHILLERQRMVPVPYALPRNDLETTVQPLFDFEEPSASPAIRNWPRLATPLAQAGLPGVKGDNENDEDEDGSPGPSPSEYTKMLHRARKGNSSDLTSEDKLEDEILDEPAKTAQPDSPAPRFSARNQSLIPAFDTYAHWPGDRWTYPAPRYLTPLALPNQYRTQTHFSGTPNLRGNVNPQPQSQPKPNTKPRGTYYARLKKQLIEHGVAFKPFSRCSKNPKAERQTSEDIIVTKALTFGKSVSSLDVRVVTWLNIDSIAPLTTHPDESHPPEPEPEPEPERERATRFTPSEQLQYPPALVREYGKNQYKWVDKGRHSRKTVFVVTHQVGYDIRDMRVYNRLKEANLDCMNLMQKRHPELFAVPLPSETEAMRIKAEEPRSIQDIFRSEGVERIPTRDEQLAEGAAGGEERQLLIKDEDPDADTPPRTLAASQEKRQKKVDDSMSQNTHATNTNEMAGLECSYVYNGSWKFATAGTLKLNGLLPNGEDVKISSNLKNSRLPPLSRKERLEAAKVAKVAKAVRASTVVSQEKSN